MVYLQLQKATAKPEPVFGRRWIEAGSFFERSHRRFEVFSLLSQNTVHEGGLAEIVTQCRHFAGCAHRFVVEFLRTLGLKNIAVFVKFFFDCLDQLRRVIFGFGAVIEFIAETGNVKKSPLM